MLGVDLSYAQAGINIEALPADGVQFVILKASSGEGGSYYVDSQYRGHANRIRKAGMKLGHYHWGDSRLNPEQSADYFYDNLTAYSAEDVLALDVEGNYAPSVDWCNRFFDRMKARQPGANLFIYTMGSIARGRDWSSTKDRGVRLWLALSSNGGVWGQPSIVQTSWEGRFAGHSPIDTNEAAADTFRTPVTATITGVDPELYRVVNLVNDGIWVVGPTGKRAHIQTPYHVNLLERLLNGAGNSRETFYGVEIDIINSYIAKI